MLLKAAITKKLKLEPKEDKDLIILTQNTQIKSLQNIIEELKLAHNLSHTTLTKEVIKNDNDNVYLE